jgi:glutamyl-tRNA reductase
MNFQVVGCSHHNAPIAVREQLAFSESQARAALGEFRRQFPDVEVVLLSTCNRVELYAAADVSCPELPEVAEFFGRVQGINASELAGHLHEYADEMAVEHLFNVAASLDSMVIGEPQILAQVKHAYQTAVEEGSAGPMLHAAFQAALKAARRIVGETSIQQRHVSIPSVAVGDFAQNIFERFDDKNTLVIGAGEMAEETLRYLRDHGARQVTVVNRSIERASELALRWDGTPLPWSRLAAALTAADLVISATGAQEPVVTLKQFLEIEPSRKARPLFILDLAVPRDFEPAIGDRSEVYLYSVDDLRQACARNLADRDKELPAAKRIIAQEADRFFTDLHHRAAGPIIRQLKAGWQKPKDEELRRLFNRLPQLEAHDREEICESFDRLVNKLLHLPLESLRDESRRGFPKALVDAMVRLFQLGE